jgi:hypothetical protein
MGHPAFFCRCGKYYGHYGALAGLTSGSAGSHAGPFSPDLPNGWRSHADSEGLGINPKDDGSAVGAALILGPPAPVSLGSGGTCSPLQPSYFTPVRRINQYTGSPEMTRAKPGQVVAGRLMNKQSTTTLAPRT